VNQASIQVAILDELATAVKAGKYTGSTGTPKSLVLVGHSFGSALSAAAVTVSPDLADGLILTGFSYNGSNGAGFLESFAPRIASQEHSRWDKLDTGYLAPVDIYSNVNV
jgi:pimeloyl-ACP methyl ester carboxylesterase